MANFELMEPIVKQLPDLLKRGAKLIPGAAKRLSPHISIHQTLVIESAVMKKDYLQDLVFLTKMGMPVKKAAELLGLSWQYAYRLLSSIKK